MKESTVRVQDVNSLQNNDAYIHLKASFGKTCCRYPVPSFSGCFSFSTPVSNVNLSKTSEDFTTNSN